MKFVTGRDARFCGAKDRSHNVKRMCKPQPLLNLHNLLTMSGELILFLGEYSLVPLEYEFPKTKKECSSFFVNELECCHHVELSNRWKPSTRFI